MYGPICLPLDISLLNADDIAGHKAIKIENGKIVLARDQHTKSDNS